MKKTVLSIAALLLCLLAHSQEADSLSVSTAPAVSVGESIESTITPSDETEAPKTGVELLIVPKLELQPDISPSFSLGGTSLYTNFSGNITENLSFLLLNQWISFDGLNFTSKDLYTGLLKSDVFNWIQFAYFQYEYKGLTFRFGKDAIYVGGFEMEEYDYDSFGCMNSELWKALPCYQWGASVGYTLPSETTTFSLQAMTSPYGHRPFASNMYSYGFRWDGNYGVFSNAWSLSAVQRTAKEFDWVLSLGNKFTFGDFTIGVDYINKMGCCEEDMPVMLPGGTLIGSFKWQPSEMFNLLAKGAWEYSNIDATVNHHFFGAIKGELFPIKNNTDFRIHLAVVGGSFRNTLTFNTGVTYYFRIPRQRK